MQAESGRNRVKVDKEEARILKDKLAEFDRIYEEEQSKFQNSTEEDYFIVSTKYIEQWREFCGSN